MHAPHVDVGLGSKQTTRSPATKTLDFLWLELTNRCNLRCVHCYTESHPHSGDRDVLTAQDYDSLMRQAYDLGCRKLQFIGGEPQLNRDFQKLLVTANTIGFDFIEVFSNLTQLDDETICYAASNGICFATSVYSDEPEAHDAITGVRSSHARTIRNLKKLIDKGIETRAATIVINQDQANVARTKRFLVELGVSQVRSAETREFGRGEEILSRPARLEGLCGHCWSGKLCIAPDGAAYPCVMARQWPVGNVLEMSLAEIVAGRSLEDMRQAIFDTVWLPKLADAGNGGEVGTHELEMVRKPSKPQKPHKPQKPPKPCAPFKLNPKHPHKPKTKPGHPAQKPSDDECFPCPQSCVPDTVPPECPQSCGPFPACVPGEKKKKKE
jgi:MoaA/NifB/PqqE/SkfB family radical SAM enzyme